jgi:hypothetical protein
VQRWTLDVVFGAMFVGIAVVAGALVGSITIPVALLVTALADAIFSLDHETESRIVTWTCVGVGIAVALGVIGSVARRSRPAVSRT